MTPQVLDLNLINSIREWYMSPRQLGAARGIKQFYRILLGENKIPRATGWAEFERVFTSWPAWAKFAENRTSKSKRRKSYQAYKSFNIDAELAMDVAFMKQPSYPQRYIGFVVVVNVCTRFVSAELIKGKGATALIRALEEIIRKTGIKPAFIYTDKESAVRGNVFKEWAGEKQIKITFTNSLFKVGLAEREIKYIKQSLDKYTDQQKAKNRWADFLQTIVTNQNNTYNHVVGGVPAQINRENVWSYIKQRYGPLHESFEEWYKGQKKDARAVKTRSHKLLKSKDGYLFVGQPVYVNLASVQLLQDSRDPTTARSKTG